MSLLPLILAGIGYSVWACYGRKRPDSGWQNKAISSVIILLFLIHPNLVQYMFGAFDCYNVDGTKRVRSDLQVICYYSHHSYWAFIVALPSIIVWGLGIPLFAFILLNKEKTKLKTLAVKQKFGFLYNGYRKEYYFWEVVIMYRKILIVFIAVFLVNLGTITQALVVFILVIIFLIINLKKKPFI